MAKLRKLFLKSNEILEKGASDYQLQLKKINGEFTIHTEGAMKEADAWRERISEIKEGIQNWADLEADAWETIKKSIK